MTKSKLIVELFVAVLGLAPFALYSDSGPNHQIRNMHFGVSGGNVNDITRAFCCSGTLGSLVTDGTSQYVLSNNHVLARQDQAVAGENISQPGLIDTSCRPTTIVANLTTAPRLGSNVDAAIAQLIPGTMDSTGFIEDIGLLGSSNEAPTVGLPVEKSGRTTGLTTGSIGSINTSVKVQYQISCGSGKKYTISYTNQVVINSTTFSAGGDSGSLIVSNDGTASPVALLFAGSSSTTIGNPIGEVLTDVGAALGHSVSFVNGGHGKPTASSVTSQTSGSTTSASSSRIPQQAMEHAARVLEQNRQSLMAQAAVLGVGLGASDDGAEPAIVVYVDRGASTKAQVPDQLDGVRTKVASTDAIVAF